MTKWQRDWRTLYLLNDQGVNKFDMTVQPGRRDGDQGSVKYTECEDVAKMVLVAVNAHAGLVEALERWETHQDGCAAIKGPPPETWVEDSACDCGLVEARAALAAARGEVK